MLANTDEHQLVPSPSLEVVLNDLRRHVRFSVESLNQINWSDADLEKNKIAVLETGSEPEPNYIKNLKAKLSRKRRVKDSDGVGVGALGFSVPVSNESPSCSGWSTISLSLTSRSMTISKSQIPQIWLPPTTETQFLTMRYLTTITFFSNPGCNTYPVSWNPRKRTYTVCSIHWLTMCTGKKTHVCCCECA